MVRDIDKNNIYGSQSGLISIYDELCILNETENEDLTLKKHIDQNTFKLTINYRKDILLPNPEITSKL